MDPILRDNAVVGPTACAFCGTFGTAVIDTGIDLLGHGRINICTRLTDDGQVGCAEIIGRLGGNLVDRTEYELILRDAGGKATKIEALEAELAETARVTDENVSAIIAAVERREPAAKKPPAAKRASK